MESGEEASSNALIEESSQLEGGGGGGGDNGRGGGGGDGSGCGCLKLKAVDLWRRRTKFAFD